MPVQPEDMKLVEADFRAALTDALQGLAGLSNSALSQVLDKYAPRFAMLAAMDPAAAAETYDDLVVNIRADQLVNSIDAQTHGAAAMKRGLLIAARLARSMILPGVVA